MKRDISEVESGGDGMLLGVFFVWVVALLSCVVFVFFCFSEIESGGDGMLLSVFFVWVVALLSCVVFVFFCCDNLSRLCFCHVAWDI